MSQLDAFQADLEACCGIARAARLLPGYDGHPDDALQAQLAEVIAALGLAAADGPEAERQLSQARWRLRRRLIGVASALEAIATAQLGQLHDAHATWWDEPRVIVLPGGEVAFEPSFARGPEASFAAMGAGTAYAVWAGFDAHETARRAGKPPAAPQP
ncbi:MAG: hypothetical protein VKS61_13665 [Candidatus Sericytochromatia bacterium]|nr:hypothetical protein [Candidatus Sericytochromatia bacterium]